MKAVVVLFGFLGLTNYFFFFNPRDDNKFWEAIYVITNAFLQGLQGILVSILYCFFSPDVRLAIATKLYRFKVRWRSRNIRRENSRRFRQSQKGYSNGSATRLHFNNRNESPPKTRSIKWNLNRKTKDSPEDPPARFRIKEDKELNCKDDIHFDTIKNLGSEVDHTKQKERKKSPTTKCSVLSACIHQTETPENDSDLQTVQPDIVQTSTNCRRMRESRV